MSRFDSLITGSVNLFFLPFFLSFFPPPTPFAFLVFVYNRTRTNVGGERGREGGRRWKKWKKEKKEGWGGGGDVDITFRYSFLRRVIIVA